MKVVIAIDSFKGCLTSEEAGLAAAKAFPAGEAEVLLVSDGGEGFSSIVTDSLGGEFRSVRCHDPLGRLINTRYGLAQGYVPGVGFCSAQRVDPKYSLVRSNDEPGMSFHPGGQETASRDNLVHNGRIAVIETAAASGLGLLKKTELNPARASSFGTGEMIADALAQGVREIWIGLGGSATCDGGTGMLKALGYRFLSDGIEITESNAILGKITEIDSSNRNKLLDSCRIIGFYDVSVPFCGEGGAARMFAPQKGASTQLVDKLDDGLSRLAEVVGNGIMNCPGAGAAGGIGGALHSVLGASMRRGISAMLDIQGLDKKLRDCEIVITGEGRADEQTLQGKVPAGVLEYVRSHSLVHTKVLLIAGQIYDREKLLAAGFDDVLQITPDNMPIEEALNPSVAKANINRAISDYLHE